MCQFFFLLNFLWKQEGLLKSSDFTKSFSLKNDFFLLRELKSDIFDENSKLIICSIVSKK